MQKRDREVHFVMSPEEIERMRLKMEELGIRSQSAYLRKMAMDGYCINLELEDLTTVRSLLRYCSNNLNQYAKRAMKYKYLQVLIGYPSMCEFPLQ